MADRDHRVGLGERVVGEGQALDGGGVGDVVPSQFEHGGGGVGGHDPVAGVEQVPGEEAAAAPQLEHHAGTGADRFEEGQDARRAQVGVEAEPEVVGSGEVHLSASHGRGDGTGPDPVADVRRGP